LPGTLNPFWLLEELSDTDKVLATPSGAV